MCDNSLYMKYMGGRGGGGSMDPPHLSFWYVAVFQNDFTFRREPLIFLYKMRHILWVLALLGACDVTNVGCHLGFYQELEIRLKPREMVIFLCLRWKVTHKQALCRTLATRFTFIVEKSWKNMYFHSKMACPPPTYDVIYRNDHHWTWLKMSARDERTATENIKCWCFIL